MNAPRGISGLPRACSRSHGGCAALNRDTFICDEHNKTTVDLQAHRATSDLDELDLDDEQTTEAA